MNTTNLHTYIFEEWNFTIGITLLQIVCAVVLLHSWGKLWLVGSSSRYIPTSPLSFRTQNLFRKILMGFIRATLELALKTDWKSIFWHPHQNFGNIYIIMRLCVRPSGCANSAISQPISNLSTSMDSPWPRDSKKISWARSEHKQKSF